MLHKNLKQGLILVGVVVLLSAVGGMFFRPAVAEVEPSPVPVASDCERLLLGATEDKAYIAKEASELRTLSEDLYRDYMDCFWAFYCLNSPDYCAANTEFTEEELHLISISCESARNNLKYNESFDYLFGDS